MDENTDPRAVRQAEPGRAVDTHVLQRTAEHLVERWAGTFPPELVERMVFESYASLARTAKVRAYLAPLAGHFAADRLTALAHAQGRGGTGVEQVLFVDEDDTGRSQIAAALLAEYAQGAVVARSAGFSAGEAVDPRVLEVLAERGVDVSRIYPKPVTDDVVRAADRVVVFGSRDGIRVYPGTIQEHWSVGGLLNAASPERFQEVVAAVDFRVQELWRQLRAGADASSAAAGTTAQ